MMNEYDYFDYLEMSSMLGFNNYYKITRGD